MQLQHDSDDGVAVLAVSGSVLAADAALLVGSVERAWTTVPRGVVVDLHRVTSMAAEAVTALAALAARSRPWPHPSLSVCCFPEGADVNGLPVHSDRAEALRHVDDRQAAAVERVELPNGPQGPGCARQAVAALAVELGLADLVDDLQLVVSEMVTNAVRHACAPVTLELLAQVNGLLIAVADGSPREPFARDADEDAEGGRGLLLVDLLSAEHGVRPEPPGKTVWAALTLDGPAC